ncbi:MAG: hypothetical protein AB4041_18150 [Microcystaceae cyanobacterium]
MTLRWNPAIAATFIINVPTNSGQIITGQITAFDQSNLTVTEAYNYNLADAKYNGIVPIETGTNLFFAETLEGLSLFIVNEAPPAPIGGSTIGQVRYRVITIGTVLFRDDVIDVDNDPLQIIPNEDETTTFISTEGYEDIGCLDGVCRTDGLVIGLNNANVSINFKYDPVTFPLINIDTVSFWSSKLEDNFAVGVGNETDEFDPFTGEITLKPLNVPESSSIVGLIGFCTVSFALSWLKHRG